MEHPHVKRRVFLDEAGGDPQGGVVALLVEDDQLQVQRGMGRDRAETLHRRRQRRLSLKHGMMTLSSGCQFISP